MGKFLFWFVALSLAIAWWRGKLGKRALDKSTRQAKSPGIHSSADASHANSTQPETMLCCAHCGVHFPQSDAVYAQEKVFCSVAHCAAHTQPKQS